MPTLDDVFGKKEYEPRMLNLKNQGEFVKGVITKVNEAYHSHEMVRTDTGWKNGKNKYWVDGKPVAMDDESARTAGFNAVTETVLTLSDVVGHWKGKTDDVKEVRISVTGSKALREALKAGMLAVEGNSFDVGDVFGLKLDDRDGNVKYFSVKIIKQG